MVWQGRRYPVVGIEQRWRTPQGPGFRVETEPGIPFELHYSERENVWTIQPIAALEFGNRDRDKQEGESDHQDHGD